MRSRVVSAAVIVLAGASWAPVAFAAAQAMPPLKLAAGPTVSLDRAGHVANFNLGGLMAPAGFGVLAIFYLANPLINGPLAEVAPMLLERL